MFDSLAYTHTTRKNNLTLFMLGCGFEWGWLIFTEKKSLLKSAKLKPVFSLLIRIDRDVTELPYEARSRVKYVSHKWGYSVVCSILLILMSWILSLLPSKLHNLIDKAFIIGDKKCGYDTIFFYSHWEHLQIFPNISIKKSRTSEELAWSAMP